MSDLKRFLADSNLLPHRSLPILISSRVRLARNLADKVFPERLSPQEREDIKQCILSTLKKLPELADSVCFEMHDLALSEAEMLVERHLISKELVEREGAAVVISPDRKLSIMINEEDHFRIQVMDAEMNLSLLAETARTLSEAIARELPFASSPRYGFLTACPTNLGTGMRASVMMFLPALTRGGYMESLANRLSKIGLTVRGLFGEGSGAHGSIYQISNQVTLGVSEEEILRRLNEAVTQITASEQKARESITGDALDRLTDRIKRSEGVLKYAYMISSSEFIKLFSDVRFGIALGVVEGVGYGQLGELLVAAMPATLTLEAEPSPKTEAARDKLRAKKIQSILLGH